MGEERFWVKDENSTNGTYVNDKRIDAPQSLEDGDKIKIGKYVLQFHVKKIRVKSPYNPCYPTDGSALSRASKVVWRSENLSVAYSSSGVGMSLTMMSVPPPRRVFPEALLRIDDETCSQDEHEIRLPGMTVRRFQCFTGKHFTKKGYIRFYRATTVRTRRDFIPPHKCRDFLKTHGE